MDSKSVVMLVPDDRIDRRVLLEARSLRKAGWQVTVIAAPPPFTGYRLDEECFPEIKIVRIDGEKAAKLPTSLKLSDPKLNRDWREFYWYSNQFCSEAFKIPAKVYVAHDLPVLPAATLVAKHYNSRLVYDAHELYPEQKHFGPERTHLYTEVETLLSPYADEVITVNMSIAKELKERYGVNLPKVILNCPEVDNNEFPVQSNILKTTLGIPENMKILLFQGSLSLNRNLENLVKAMALIARKDVVLVILGPGDEKRKELLNIALEQGTLKRKVFFHDPVPQSELLRYTASADAGIIPYPHVDLNSYYCTPNKLFEFIVAGLPILGNKSPELIRYISEQGLGLNMIMDDQITIAIAIDDFFTQDLTPFREKVQVIRQKYVWSEESSKIVSIYEELIRQSQI
ncbi:glycosyltransferase [Desulfosporosinus fructosivorans]